MADLAVIESELKAFIERHKGRSAEVDSRLRVIEQTLVQRGGGPGLSLDKSLGAILTERAGFASFRKGTRSSGQVECGSFLRKASNIVTGPWSVGPDYKPIVAQPGQPRLPLRGLIPSFATVSNLVEFPREDATSGGPDYQVTEGTDKPQTDFTYSLQQARVCTLAHWVAASKQMVDDSVAFSGYVDGRLLYMLESKTERELIYGSGASGHLKGIAVQATPASGSSTNLIDATASAISQLASAGFHADGIVCHPTDWWIARQSKSSGSGTYLIGDPLNQLAPTLWGLSVSLSVGINAGHFLVGVFRNAAAIFDREQASIEVSREHASFFTQNLVAILAEERLALACFRGDAFVYGALAGATGS